MRKERAGQVRWLKPAYRGSTKVWDGMLEMREVVSMIETVTVEVEGGMWRGGGGVGVRDMGGDLLNRGIGKFVEYRDYPWETYYCTR